MALLAACVASSACNVALVEGLNEPSANEVVVALTEADIAATKDRDPDREGHYRVSVAREDVPAALLTLKGAGLPEPAMPGVLEALGDEALVPSRTAERARFLEGVAGELETSLRGVSGVLSARVHLSIPDRDPLDAESASLPTASVLVRHSGATPPLARDDVRRLVAGALSGLRPEAVSVVLHPVAAPTTDGRPRLSQLGPLLLTTSSASRLRWLLLGIGALNVSLSLGLVFSWVKIRRLRNEGSGIGRRRGGESENQA